MDWKSPKWEFSLGAKCTYYRALTKYSHLIEQNRKAHKVHENIFQHLAINKVLSNWKNLRTWTKTGTYKQINQMSLSKSVNNEYHHMICWYSGSDQVNLINLQMRTHWSRPTIRGLFIYHNYTYIYSSCSQTASIMMTYPDTSKFVLSVQRSNRIQLPVTNSNSPGIFAADVY